MFWESFWMLMSWFWVLTSSCIINILAHHFVARSLLIGIVSRDGAIRKEIQYVKSVIRLGLFPSHSWYFFLLSCLNLKLETMSSLSHFLGVFTKLFSSTSQKQCNYGNWYKVILNMYLTNWFLYGFFIISIFWKVLLKAWELCVNFCTFPLDLVEPYPCILKCLESICCFEFSRGDKWISWFNH